MLEQTSEKIEHFLIKPATINPTPLNGGVCGEKKNLVPTTHDLFMINPSFGMESVKYVFVQSEIYEDLDWRTFATAVFGRDLEVITFPLDVSTTSHSVLRAYDGAIVACWQLAIELYAQNGRLQFVAVIQPYTCSLQHFCPKV